MTKTAMGKVLLGMSALGLMVAHPTASSADSVSDALQVCAGCHGEQGIPVDENTPVIWGQHRDYIWNELRDFKTGRRKSDIMAGMVESLSWADLQALATYFSKQKWPEMKKDAPAPSESTDTKAHAGIDDLNCYACHQDHFQGDSHRPRLAGQQAPYLEQTMKDFRDGHRGNYIGMSVLMRDLSDDEIKAIATYLSDYKEPSVAAK